MLFRKVRLSLGGIDACLVAFAERDTRNRICRAFYPETRSSIPETKIGEDPLHQPYICLIVPSEDVEITFPYGNCIGVDRLEKFFVLFGGFLVVRFPSVLLLLADSLVVVERNIVRSIDVNHVHALLADKTVYHDSIRRISAD